jgi:NinB protein
MKTWSLTESNLPFLLQHLKELDYSKSWQVVIKEKESNRTLGQNARLWDLYTSIGSYLGYTKDEVHELMGYKFLRYQKTIGDNTVELIESTTKLSTKRMGEYQEQIEIWASQMGWSWND